MNEISIHIGFQVYRANYSIDDPMNQQTDAIFKECAVKRMSLTPESQILSFSEVFVLKRLLHPNIIGLLGVKDEESVKAPGHHASSTLNTAFNSTRLLLILELASNGNVWDYINKNKKSIGLKMWLKWSLQAVSAVVYMHGEGIVNHDIKPHNMLVFIQSFQILKKDYDLISSLKI